MSADNVTPIRPPKNGGGPTLRTEENDVDVSLVLIAIRFQFEAIEVALDTEGNDVKASYLALGGALIVQRLIERLDSEEGP